MIAIPIRVDPKTGRCSSGRRLRNAIIRFLLMTHGNFPFQPPQPLKIQPLPQFPPQPTPQPGLARTPRSATQPHLSPQTNLNPRRVLGTGSHIGSGAVGEAEREAEEEGEGEVEGGITQTRVAAFKPWGVDVRLGTRLIHIMGSRTNRILKEGLYKCTAR